MALSKPDSTKPDEKADDSKADASAPVADQKPDLTTAPTGTPVPGPLDVQRVQIEQAPAEPAVYYDGETSVPKNPPVKADYQPFEW